jgi:hypothetical protein
MPNFRLDELGWKAFEDLCGTIGRQIMGAELQTFSEGGDAGRDGAFIGTWRHDGVTLSGTTVVQCKHFGYPGASLTLSRISDELEKLQELVKAGRCENYVLMCNGKLSAGSEAKIRNAVMDTGVDEFIILAGQTINGLISENQRLRSLVPRLYGLGDLSQIIDDRAYEQAARLLESLRYDIQTFVPTDSYRKAAESLAQHGLVLLLGEPAAGKSVIAATLALSGTDLWRSWTIKADDARQFVEHWNPHEANQFFWIDDAFGATQLQDSKVEEWNQVFVKMRAATRGGTRIVITSRDYIWNAARRRLKLQAWPELESGEVVVDVEDITTAERERILYNHMRLGRQPTEFKREIKPLLEGVANHDRFLPELARRLADPLFTRTLEIDSQHLDRFVDEPEPFLVEVVTNLDAAARAALTLLVMSASQLDSPISLDENQRHAISMLGVSEASVREALTVLDGSLVKLTITETGGRAWAPRHPTIVDAMTSIMRQEPELLEIYLRMAKIHRLIQEISCGAERQGTVLVPESLFTLVIERLAELAEPGSSYVDRDLLGFLTFRCGEQFLRQFFVPRLHLSDQLLNPASPIDETSELALLTRLRQLSLVTDTQLEKFADHLSEAAVTMLDPSFDSAAIEALLGEARAASLRAEVHDELDHSYSDILVNWGENFDTSESPEDYLAPLFGAIDRLGLDDWLEEAKTLELELYDARRQAGYDEDNHDYDDWRAELAADIRVDTGDDSERSIFDDVDG